MIEGSKGQRGKLKQIDEQATLRRALGAGYITDWSLAVDGGAHVGGWTRIMAEHFQIVHAFEPAPDTFKVLTENLAAVPNVRLYNMALMQKRQFGTMRLDVTTTARKFAPGAGGDILAVGLDEFNFPSCGLIKLDLEGCDYFALEGAAETIKRHRPFLIVELGEHLHKGLSERFGVSNDDVAGWLTKRGYTEVFREGVNVGYLSK